MSKLVATAFVMFVLALSGTAHAHDHSHPLHDGQAASGAQIINQNVVVGGQGQAPVEHYPRGPSMFRSGFRGLLTGGFVGVSGGYLVARNDGDWRPLALGAGFGALAGAGFGLTLGFVDLVSDGPARAHLVLRDMLYGTTFGAVAGAVTGSLFIIKTGDAEHVLLGTSLGALSGAGLGLVVGIIDAARFGRHPCARDTSSCTASTRRYAPTLATTSDVSGALVFAPTIAGRF